MNRVKKNLNNYCVVEVEGYLISSTRLPDRQLKASHSSWNGRQAWSKALFATEGHLKKLVSFKMWYKYRCSGSLMKEKATVSCRWSKHGGNYYSEIQKQRFLLPASISCLAGSCRLQPRSNPSLILRFPFSVNLTLRCNSAAADTVQVSQFVLCLPRLHIPFSSSVPSCFRCPLSARGDSWSSFLGGPKHGVCRLQTA